MKGAINPIVIAAVALIIGGFGVYVYLGMPAQPTAGGLQAGTGGEGVIIETKTAGAFKKKVKKKPISSSNGSCNPESTNAPEKMMGDISTFQDIKFVIMNELSESSTEYHTDYVRFYEQDIGTPCDINNPPADAQYSGRDDAISSGYTSTSTVNPENSLGRIIL